MPIPERKPGDSGSSCWERERVYGLRQDWWIDERSDIVKSTHAAAQHLRDLYERFGNWDLAMAAYNVGSSRIERVRRRYGKLGLLDHGQKENAAP